ncbi:MAG: cytochrome c biogenesis protein CcsA [Myxococcota bacterium]
MTPDPIERSAIRGSRPLGIVLLILIAAWLLLVIAAPEDAVQGVVQKILYVHVPAIFSAYLGFLITALAGILYLWREEDRYDRLAASAAEVGVIFCCVFLVTGPIWAKATWGRWWTWDLRLTLTLLLWFIYLAYLLLRSFTDGSRAARFSAVYGMAALVVIPLNYFAIDLAGGRSMHPENLERGSLGAGMGWPFLAGVLTSLVAFFYLLALRLRVAAGRAREAERAAVAAEAEAEGIA